MSVKFNIVRFMGASILLESGWKMTAGMKPNINRATCSHIEYAKITLGQPGSVQFFFSSQQSADLTLANWVCVDAEPIKYGGAGTSSAQAISYRLIFTDSRYAFVEPRGGRLSVGIINPSTQIPADADRTKVPSPRTMTECIQACLTEMGISASIPSTSVDPPKDLKWLGSHAPSELEKLLSLTDMIFCLQADGTYTIKNRNSGSEPNIPAGRQLPSTNLDGADVRGDTVVFASYPTQVINTITETDINPSEDLTIVFKNSDQAWQKIDNCGAYGSGSAVTEMNHHFSSTADPAAQSGCYRFLRLNPDKFDPINSPILRQTYKTGGASDDNPNGLPPLIDIHITANIAVQDPKTKLWKNGSQVVVPVDRIIDGNVLSLHHRLVKLNSSTSSTADLEGNCVAINLSSDIKIRLSVCSSSWDSGNTLFKPEYFLCGFNGSATSPAMMSQDQCKSALAARQTLVIPIAELVAMRYGMDESDDVVNLTNLQNQCKALAPRYLKDTQNTAKQIEGVGFLPFTLDGKVSEVEFDQTAIVTRFLINATFRPVCHTSHHELNRIRKPKESHPHESKMAGVRASRGEAGSSAPVHAMQQFIPPGGLPAYVAFAVSVTQNGGTNGSQTTSCSFTYDVFSNLDGSKIGTKLSVEWPRYSKGNMTAATVGNAYYDRDNTLRLFQAGEVLSTIACAS